MATPMAIPESGSAFIPVLHAQDRRPIRGGGRNAGGSGSGEWRRHPSISMGPCTVKLACAGAARIGGIEKSGRDAPRPGWSEDTTAHPVVANDCVLRTARAKHATKMGQHRLSRKCVCGREILI